MAIHNDGVTPHRLWRLMYARGLRYDWLAQQTGYAKSYILSLRHAKFPIQPRFWAAAAAALGVRPEDVAAYDASEPWNEPYRLPDGSPAAKPTPSRRRRDELGVGG